MQPVTIVIPVYKQHALFQKSLLHNLPFMKDASLIIINDDPTSTYPEALSLPSRDYSSITWLNNSANLGFAGSVNTAVSHVTTPYFFLLNSDVFLRDDGWTQLIDPFVNNPNIFAIALAQYEKDGTLVGRNRLYFGNGLFEHSGIPIQPTEVSAQKLLSTAWAEGGSSLFDTLKWKELGGFDSAYSPFYWEDVDLSYRAKQHGWEVYIAAHIQVDHHHESTIGSLFAQTKNDIAFRNQLYFTRTHARGLQHISAAWFRLKRAAKKLLHSLPKKESHDKDGVDKTN